MYKALLAILITVSSIIGTAQSPEPTTMRGQYFSLEWNTVMFRNTFRIQGPSASQPGKDSVGTVFFLFAPNKGELQAFYKDSKQKLTGSMVLVTAAHVLTGITGDTAILYMRTQEENGSWNEVKISLEIRRSGHPLWQQHPTDDLAVLLVDSSRIDSHLTEPFIWTTYLATDKWIVDYQLHPGDEVTCLGFPEGLHSSYGFPILRAGRIASFPIVPTLLSRPLYIDFPVYGGNSGGPAYIVPPAARGNTMTINGRLTLLGLVIEKQFADSDTVEAVTTTGSSKGTTRQDMHLAILVPAPIITETIALLGLP